MTLEELIPEIRKGKRWRLKGETEWRGPWEAGKCKMLTTHWMDLEEDFEVEPELEVIEVKTLTPDVSQSWTVSKRGWRANWTSTSNPILCHEDIDALHAASLRIRGVPASAKRTYEKWYLNKYKESPQIENSVLEAAFIEAYQLGQQSVFSDPLPSLSLEQAWELYNPNEQFNRVLMSAEFKWAFEAGQRSKAPLMPAISLSTLPTKVCLTCKGEKGFEDTTYDRTGEWVGCDVCSGHGYVFQIGDLYKAHEAAMKGEQ